MLALRVKEDHFDELFLEDGAQSPGVGTGDRAAPRHGDDVEPFARNPCSAELPRHTTVTGRPRAPAARRDGEGARAPDQCVASVIEQGAHRSVTGRFREPRSHLVARTARRAGDGRCRAARAARRACPARRSHRDRERGSDRRARRSRAVRDDEHGAAGEQPVDRLLHQALRLGVERRSGFIENEDRRVGEQGPRDRQALSLAAGEAACRARRAACRSRAGAR